MKFFFLLLLHTIRLISAELSFFTDLADTLGPSLCQFIASEPRLARSAHGIEYCSELTCTERRSWEDALYSGGRIPHRVVLLYDSSGFGNQLFMHSFAFMVAAQLNAPFFFDFFTHEMYPYGMENAGVSFSAMEQIMPAAQRYRELGKNHPIRRLCDAESFIIRGHREDFKNDSYIESFSEEMRSLITDEKPRCIKLAGFFQKLPYCFSIMKDLWAARITNAVNMTGVELPGANDISIYLRCHIHYFTLPPEYYEEILDNTSFEYVWLFRSPDCRGFGEVENMLHKKYSVKMWQGLEGGTDAEALLFDMVGLMKSKKMILADSTWSFWSGLLSDATEIHVSSHHHPYVPDMDKFIYSPNHPSQRHPNRRRRRIY